MNPYAAEAERMRKEYVESRILSAHPVEIVAGLYEAAVTSLNEAIGHLRAGDRLARSRAITRAEHAVQELWFALDHSVNPAFSRRSADLYQYALGRMVAGHARESEREFQEALSVLTPLAGAWAEVKTRVTPEPKQAEETAVESERQAGSDPYAAYRQDGGAVTGRDWSG
jgi:flagellin-specific chaperone FliS